MNGIEEVNKDPMMAQGLINPIYRPGMAMARRHCLSWNSSSIIEMPWHRDGAYIRVWRLSSVVSSALAGEPGAFDLRKTQVGDWTGSGSKAESCVWWPTCWKTIIAFQRHGDFKEGRSDIFIFLEKSFCGRMLAEVPDKRQGKQLDYGRRAMIRVCIQLETVR